MLVKGKMVAFLKTGFNHCMMKYLIWIDSLSSNLFSEFD